MKEIETIGFTSSAKKHYCRHGNGWYQKVTIKRWIFTFHERVFLCLDCESLVPANEASIYNKKTKTP